MFEEPIGSFYLNSDPQETLLRLMECGEETDVSTRVGRVGIVRGGREGVGDKGVGVGAAEIELRLEVECRV